MLVDISGSMSYGLSGKSQLHRDDVAASMAAIIKECSDESSIYKFNTSPIMIPSSRRGFSLISDILHSTGGGTSVYDCTNRALSEYQSSKGKNPDRIIIITDEQINSDMSSRLSITPKNTKGYILNVGSYENGVGYERNSNWIHINGWSENIIKYIVANEKFLNKE
jgi:uncharacterized protein with von Willebrand factor type A (vWA) domain